MGTCPFSNPPKLCNNGCALMINGECAFTVIAQNLACQSVKDGKKDQK